MAQRITASSAPNPNGLILWEGPSALDGAPIVVIATGLAKGRSRNAKTGHMVQTWILRADVAPHIAVKSGADASVCGACPHRPALAGSCYVTTFQAPRSVWDAYKRGRYARVGATLANGSALAKAGAGHIIRLGAYGDPAAAPLWVWQAFASQAASSTGYTHQWARPDMQGLRVLAMASADTAEEGLRARAMGWRTFRVRQDWETVGAREFVCPASAEAGHRTDCASCKACGGLDAKAKASPVIIAHGARAKRFTLYRNGQAIAA